MMRMGVWGRALVCARSGAHCFGRHTAGLGVALALALGAAGLLFPSLATASRPHRAVAVRLSAARLSRPPASPEHSVAVTQTAAALKQGLQALPELRFSATAPPAHLPLIVVNDQIKYQWVIGAGAAMTDSSAWLIYDELRPSVRSLLMSGLFGPLGIRLAFLRVPIGASDFTATGVPYTYDDRPAGKSDPSLQHFSIVHDEPYVLPALRDAMALDPGLFVEAVPWSPPAWMKGNDALDNMGHAGTLLPADYNTLADYFVKFLQAYAAQGVRVDAIAPQNEPGVAASYPGAELSESDEAQFITGHLRPALEAAGLDPAVFGWDSSWGSLTAGDPLISIDDGELTGLAWHCYYGSPTMMTDTHRAAPTLLQIVDECSTGAFEPASTSEMLIASFRNWASAVSLWNLALDPQGGPVQAPNAGCSGCTGVVVIDPRTGTVTPTADYYELGQLSRYVRPGAVRIASNHFVSYGVTSAYRPRITDGLDDVAFLNPDGSKVLLVYNNSARPIPFAINWHGAFLRYTSPAQATTTFTWR